MLLQPESMRCHMLAGSSGKLHPQLEMDNKRMLEFVKNNAYMCKRIITDTCTAYNLHCTHQVLPCHAHDLHTGTSSQMKQSDLAACEQTCKSGSLGAEGSEAGS